MIVAVNAGTAPAIASFDAAMQSQPSKLLYGSAEVEWADVGESRQLTLNLPSRTGCILASE